MTESELPKEPGTVSWKLAMLVLLGVPCLLAFVLKVWLGVASETADPGVAFEHLGLTPVKVEECVSYQYGHLFFSRFRVAPGEQAAILSQLKSWSTTHGLPKEPVSFKLKRDWWDMDQSEKGDEWDRERQHLFRPESEPNLFYAVVELAGDAPTASKSPR